MVCNAYRIMILQLWWIINSVPDGHAYCTVGDVAYIYGGDFALLVVMIVQYNGG